MIKEDFILLWRLSSRVVSVAALFIVSLDAGYTIAEWAFPQEVRRPSGRAIPGPTWTPTATLTPTPTPTPTPEPDPCSGCMEPGSYWCEMLPEICYQCWEDCGNPQATPTPTRTSTPTRTPTPQATPTPNGPACELSAPSGAIYLVAYYAHESEVRGVRYSYKTAPVTYRPGRTVKPCPCQGFPIGFEWFTVAGAVLKSCGDTSTAHWHSHIFSDGFETGDTDRWSLVVGDE